MVTLGSYQFEKILGKMVNGRNDRSMAVTTHTSRAQSVLWIPTMQENKLSIQPEPYR